MADLIFYFRLYIYGAFCQHIYKITNHKSDHFDTYMCAKCWRVMVIEKDKL